MKRWSRVLWIGATILMIAGPAPGAAADTKESAAGHRASGTTGRAKSQGKRRDKASPRAHRKTDAKKPHRGKARPQRAKRKPSRGKAKPARAHRRPVGVYSLDTKWHQPAEPGDCPALKDAPPGSWGVIPIKTRECEVLPLIDPMSADIADDALQTARGAWASKRNGSTHDVHPRLLQMLQRGVTHFHVPYVHVISGFRTGNASSRHGHGLAVDVVFPGVTNKQLAEFMRKQGFMGVGIYMRTGFVHLDVREKSYFWLDWSPPGKKWRGKMVRMDEARAADEAAVARGESPFEAPGEMRSALARREERRAKARAKAQAREAAATATAAVVPVAGRSSRSTRRR